MSVEVYPGRSSGRAALGRRDPTRASSSPAIHRSARRGLEAISALTPWAFLPYLILALTASYTFAMTTDDCFIVFRYAKNLVAGNGLVFNPGERVEGFSSPLHVLLCAVMFLVTQRDDILVLAKLFGVACALVTVALAGRTSRLCGLSPRDAVVVQCVTALNVNFAISAVNALETSLYGMILLLGVNRSIRELRDRAGYLSAALFSLALVTRPDAIVLIGVLLVGRIAWFRLGRRGQSTNVAWAGILVLTCLLVTAARLSYYGELLPNTVHAKDVGLAYGIKNGLCYLCRTLWPTLFAAERTASFMDSTMRTVAQAAYAIGFWGLALVGLWRDRRHAAGVVCLLLISGQGLMVLRSGGDWMVGWRFMVPVLPLLTIAQVSGIRRIAATIARVRSASARRIHRAALAVLCAVALIALATAPHDSWSWASVGFSPREDDLLAASGGNTTRIGALQVKAAYYLRDHFRPGAVIASSEMGFGPFINLDKKFVDTRGLTEPALAKAPRRYKTRFGFVDLDVADPESPLHRTLVTRRPDAYLQLGWGQEPKMRELKVADREFRHVETVGGMNRPGRFPLVIHVFVPTAAR